MSFPFVQPYFGLGNSLQTAQGAAGGGASGGWVELGRTTLGSAGDDITVSSLPDKRYYMVLASLPDTGQANQKIRLGYSSVDSGSNYAWRASTNGGADNTSTSADHMNLTVDAIYDTKFSIGYLSNLSSKEKLTQWWTNERTGVGAGNPPVRKELVGKWTNTSNPLDVVNFFNSASGSFATGSEVVVLGWDPADTHTTNFWEELASVDLSGGAATNLSSGTISAKKYLWVQYYAQFVSGTDDIRFTFNNDTGTNYADRRSINGAGDGTKINQTNWEDEGGVVSGRGVFVNMFIINNASNEKLGIVHSIRDIGGAAATAPQRREWVAKWANTSDQITEIDLTSSSANFDTVTSMNVWGAN